MGNLVGVSTQQGLDVLKCDCVSLQLTPALPAAPPGNSVLSLCIVASSAGVCKCPIFPLLPPPQAQPTPCSLMTTENRRAGSVSFCSFSFLPHLCVTRLLPFQSLLFLCVPKLPGRLLPPWRAWLQASRAEDGLRGWGCSGGRGELAWALRLSCGLALNPRLSSNLIFHLVVWESPCEANNHIV